MSLQALSESVPAAYQDRELTKSLLKRDFGLELELPDDRLCPPVGDGRPFQGDG